MIELSLSSAEKVALVRALTAAHGDLTKTAELLGIARSTIYSKICQHDLQEFVTELRTARASGAE